MAKPAINPTVFRLASAHFVSDAYSNLIMAAATQLQGWGFVVMMAIGGFFLQSTLPVNITFAHQIAPVSAATVSSLMMGFAWGTGGLSVPLVGALADRIGIGPALTIMACRPLAGAICVLPLPKPVEGEPHAS